MVRFKQLLLSLVCLISIKSYSQESLYEQQINAGFEEKQGLYADLGVKLVNEAGDTVLLRQVINKPTILNLVYFECPGTCSPLMWGVSKFIDEMDLKAGTDYQVVTVSFDPTESIELGRQKKQSYFNSMKKKEAAAGWLFFVSDSADLARLTRSVGFNYIKRNNQFIHPTGLIALAPDGKIVRYMMGIDFLPFEVKITLVEAGRGKVGPSINRLLAICYSYDSKGNQFVFNVTRVSAILITFIVAVFFLFLAFSRLTFKKRSE